MRQDLPAGTVTFVFTDIEGSTALLEELGAERYGELLSQHHRVCRVAWAERGGVEGRPEAAAIMLAGAEVLYEQTEGALDEADTERTLALIRPRWASNASPISGHPDGR